MLLNFLKINCSTNVKTLGLRVNNVRNMCLHLTLAYKDCANFWQEHTSPGDCGRFHELLCISDLTFIVPYAIPYTQLLRSL